MKINKILIGGLTMLTLSACNDFLDVDTATNKAGTEFVYGSETEIRTALNGVYAKIVADNTFGNNLYNAFQLNSDVDFYANSNEAAAGNQPRRFDVRSDAGNIESFWNAFYSSVETANEFIYNLTNSELYDNEATEPTDMTQMMGEAKVIRAMLYHELLWYFGDIPFTMQATYETDNVLPPMTKRQEVSDALIEDLEEAAVLMYSDKDLSAAPERISREAAYAMIARLALQAGGYSLNHEEGDQTNYKMTCLPDAERKHYYEIARDYTRRIIDTEGHQLSKPYRDVFVDECNFVVTRGDDAIFEIPFAKETSGQWGYAQGPTNGVDTGDDKDYTNSAWGSTSGGVRTSAFYRYSFDAKDLRRDYICGMWYYSNQGLPTLRFDYAMHNNKWSKLWNTTGLGKSTTSATGINFAYIRYTDVLLMFAEAENFLDGPTVDAQEALKTVRRRAFAGANHAEKVDAYVAAATASKEDFLKAVLDERKWEFAGENMRWKDLVRNNMYAEKVLTTFLTYYSIAQQENGFAPYMDTIEEYDGIPYSQKRAPEVYAILTKNYNDPNFPNRSVYMMKVLNPDFSMAQPPMTPAQYIDDEGWDVTPVSARSITGLSSSSATVDWTKATLSWSYDDGGLRPQVLYSLYGYVRVDARNNIVVVDNGVATPLNINASDLTSTINRLPAVRYLLPYPQEVIARSSGAYKNYYGY